MVGQLQMFLPVVDCLDQLVDIVCVPPLALGVEAGLAVGPHPHRDAERDISSVFRVLRQEHLQNKQSQV